MSDIYLCPNCEARMDQGEMCPECDHTDGDDFCECEHCLRKLDEEDNRPDY